MMFASKQGHRGKPPACMHTSSLVRSVVEARETTVRTPYLAEFPTVMQFFLLLSKLLQAQQAAPKQCDRRRISERSLAATADKRVRKPFRQRRTRRKQHAVADLATASVNSDSRRRAQCAGTGWLQKPRSCCNSCRAWPGGPRSQSPIPKCAAKKHNSASEDPK